jgi:hypothetical protein
MNEDDEQRRRPVLPHHGFILSLSRKAKAARNLYEYLRQKVKPEEWIPSIQWESVHAYDGIRVPPADRHRVLNIRIHDEHLSPYFKTDMNLFHLLMIDDSVDITVFRADKGWLFVFDGIPQGPKPFGQLGYDTR